MLNNTQLSPGQAMAYLLEMENKPSKKLKLDKENLQFLQALKKSGKINKEFPKEVPLYILKSFLGENEDGFCFKFAENLNNNYEEFEKFVEILTDFNKTLHELNDQ